MKQVTAVLIGAGQRGAQSYAPYALAYPQELRFVAVAEPDESRRNAFAKAHAIPAERCFSDYNGLLACEQLADAALVCTQDRMHLEPAQKALERGYHVLLEKPMSYTPEECVQLGETAKRCGRVFSICHVLRYTPFFTKLKALLEQQVIGELINLQHIENVGYWHQAHSFVRGNWRNAGESSPMILAKCCHDMDLLLWLVGADCTKVSSFGSLSHFRADKAPVGAPARCLDGCPASEECPYYAPHIYIDWKDDWQADVIRKVVSAEGTDEAVLAALQTGPYGRCVYHCDNDVVDHQVVNLEFANGVAASLTMSAFSQQCSRSLKLMGSKGEMVCDLEENTIALTRFLTGKTEHIKVDAPAEGHGGGDRGLMRAFVALVRENGVAEQLTNAATSVQSHLMSFAAEQSRLDHTVIDLAAYTRTFL